jgi:hypothetical protein
MKTFRALGIAASLLMGAALTASAATPADNQGNPAPTAAANGGSGTQYSNGTQMAPGYTGGPTGPSSNAATTKPKLDQGNPEAAAGGGGSGGAGH